jgi:hypothetical protein
MVHLPAVNTPQFDWARSRLPRRLQPVPPIHDVRVAAEAIVRAAREAPRELWVGSPTLKAILGTMAAPGLLDDLMARRAWDGQMTGEPASPRPDNLFEAVEERASCHGRFTPVAKPRAMTASASAVRAVTGLAALGLAAALIGLARRPPAVPPNSRPIDIGPHEQRRNP